MSRKPANRRWLASDSKKSRALQPIAEMLEGRLLLYSKLGDQFVYSSRITYSFMPDGTSVGGVPSTLFSTLNANFSTAAWEQQIEQAASIWEQAANLNLSRVSDGGEAVASSGDQQDDPRFGDIRIGAVPLGPGTLAVTFLPPPANGGTDAGDILLNSSINWQINSNYDLMTVMAHEFGHALGLGDVSTPTNPYPVMYGSYVGINQALTSDDIAGIQAVDGVRQFDAYNINGARNITYMSAANITSKIGSNGQAAIPNLDITTGGDSEWFYVTVPQATTGTMNVTVQSTNLSSLSPKLMVYTSSLGLVGQASAVNSMGATSVSTSVSANQGYYIKVLAAGGYGAIGGYGLLLNFGSQTQAPIPPPNTVVAQQPDRGSGSLNNGISIAGPANPGSGAPAPVYTAIGSIQGWAEVYTAAPITPVAGPISTPISMPTALSIAPFVPSISLSPSPVPAPTSTTNKHHARASHRHLPRFTVEHRARPIKEHAKFKGHRSG